MRILVAEDDEALGGFVRRGLEAEHYAVDLSNYGEQAKSLAQQANYDLLLLDLNLPRIDGVTILRQLRVQKPSLPVLVLSARNRVEEKVQCLDLGADDFLAKPFAFAELSARIRALLRRCHTANDAVLEVADLKLDRLSRVVERAGRKIELTAREFALLEYLMSNAGRRITRSMIAEHVFGLSFDTPSNLIDVYVAYLRIVFEAGLVSAEHLTYREFLQRMPESTYIASFRALPLNVTAILQMDFSIAFPMIDLLLGGQASGDPPQRNLTEIEEQILESIVRIVLRELQSTWQALAIELSFEQRQPASQAHRLMPPEEKNLCLSFEIKMPNTRGTLNLAMPAVVSNALLRKISAD
jgi:DNA-binding response OmpR family regulator